MFVCYFEIQNSYIVFITYCSLPLLCIVMFYTAVHNPIRVIFFSVNYERSYLKITYIMCLTRHEKYAHHLFLDKTYKIMLEDTQIFYSERHLITFYSKSEVKERRNWIMKFSTQHNPV